MIEKMDKIWYNHDIINKIDELVDAVNAQPDHTVDLLRIHERIDGLKDRIQLMEHAAIPKPGEFVAVSDVDEYRKKLDELHALRIKRAPKCSKCGQDLP